MNISEGESRDRNRLGAERLNEMDIAPRHVVDSMRVNAIFAALSVQLFTVAPFDRK